MRDSSRPPPPQQTARTARDQRLAEALRENLRRRKQQARARAETDSAKSPRDRADKTTE
jgi:hypothetical protein